MQEINNAVNSRKKWTIHHYRYQSFHFRTVACNSIYMVSKSTNFLFSQDITIDKTLEICHLNLNLL